MKLLMGWLAVGLVAGATAAQAQTTAPYQVGRSPYALVSDFGGPGPYAAAVPESPRYGNGRYGYDYGPPLMPPQEVYTVLREAGFSPLGIPRQRGFVYVIAVIDRGGSDGRLVIDGRDGRIIRFVPANRIGDRFREDLMSIEAPREALPPATQVRGEPRPPRSIPHVASRTVPVPKPSPVAAKPAPEPAVHQSAETQPKPAEVPATPPAVTTGSALPKPIAQIAPTQDLPRAQGLE